ncbi:MAG: hypothetical protein O2955_12525 [Planctomycetota bacterium]|nr:hypothetical protein [Planctomycetota bacterium]MDA1213336.1 hypothetical protein [Planctomycetota bacterium]
MSIDTSQNMVAVEPESIPVEFDPVIIERLVRKRTGLLIRDLQAQVNDSEVLLTGRTSTYYTKQLATHAVLDALKMVNLTNDIEVL